MNEWTIRPFFRGGADNFRSDNSLELMLIMSDQTITIEEMELRATWIIWSIFVNTLPGVDELGFEYPHHLLRFWASLYCLVILMSTSLHFYYSITSLKNFEVKNSGPLVYLRFIMPATIWVFTLNIVLAWTTLFQILAVVFVLYPVL